MKQTSKVLVLLALTSYTFAVTGSIKERLSQMSSNNLAEIGQEQMDDAANVDFDFDWDSCQVAALPALALNCPCDLQPGQLPGAVGASETNQYTAQILSSSGQIINQIPNVAEVTNQLGQSCACNAAQQAFAARQQTVRHFEINGAINIEESVCSKQSSQMQENSLGEMHKIAQQQTETQGGSGTPPGAGCVTSCITPGGMNGGGVGSGDDNGSCGCKH